MRSGAASLSTRPTPLAAGGVGGQLGDQPCGSAAVEEKTQLHQYASALIQARHQQADTKEQRKHAAQAAAEQQQVDSATRQHHVGGDQEPVFRVERIGEIELPTVGVVFVGMKCSEMRWCAGSARRIVMLDSVLFVAALFCKLAG